MRDKVASVDNPALRNCDLLRCIARKTAHAFSACRLKVIYSNETFSHDHGRPALHETVEPITLFPWQVTRYLPAREQQFITSLTAVDRLHVLFNLSQAELVNNSPKSLDVVIPCLGAPSSSHQLLRSLVPHKDHINKVYIVLSSPNATAVGHDLIYTKDALSLRVSLREASFEGLAVVYLNTDFLLYPGAARNIGVIFSESSYTAFLDVNTYPGRNWLSEYCDAVSDDIVLSPILGRTRYSAATYFQKVFLATTYGFKPIVTLPGSILHRTHLSTVGLLNIQWRCGEDIDFIQRVKTLFPDYRCSSEVICYPLKTGNPFYYFMKWLRNYSETAPFQTLVMQSYVLSILGVLIFLAIVFRWNASLAGWDEQSVFYLRNVTKTSVLALAAFYSFVRAFYVPFKSGAFGRARCTVLDLLPFLAFSILLDSAKTLAIALRPLGLYRYFLSLRLHSWQISD